MPPVEGCWDGATSLLSGLDLPCEFLSEEEKALILGDHAARVVWSLMLHVPNIPPRVLWEGGDVKRVKRGIGDDEIGWGSHKLGANSLVMRAYLKEETKCWAGN